MACVTRALHVSLFNVWHTNEKNKLTLFKKKPKSVLVILDKIIITLNANTLISLPAGVYFIFSCFSFN